MALLADSAVAAEFPLLRETGLAYLDSAATAQKPRAVIEAVEDFTAHHNASVHRGVYPLAAEASERYEAARERIAAFTGSTARETVFTKNATEALNLVMYSWGRANVRAGEAIVLTRLEHHSNLVPWQMLAAEVGADLRYVDPDADGRLELEQLDAHLADGRARIVAATHVSNVTGTITPVADITARARAAGAISVIDGAQAVPQLPVDVAALGADFYAWTGHKAYGPTGVGVLHGRWDLLREMPPFLGGGSMIRHVDPFSSTYADPPARFEAGTPPIAEVIGLAAAVEFLEGIGMPAVREHEQDVTAYALERLAEVPGLTRYGPPEAAGRAGLVSFTLAAAHPHDVAEILGRDGVCVRAGHHCAQPLMQWLGVGATSRASFGVHSTREDVDRLVAGLGRVLEIFGD